MIRSIQKLWYWWLDYLYVSFWQLYGLAARDKSDAYIHERSDKSPVVIIPGIYEPWWFMRPVVRLLYEQGYSVYAVEGLGYNRGGIPLMAAIVDEFIRTKQLKDVIIVAHSKGGLIGKYLLANHNKQTAIAHVIAINTPFVGSIYAYLAPVRSIREFLPTSKGIKRLQANKEVNTHITSIYSSFDPHIPKGSSLEGARNIKLPVMGHFRIMSEPQFHAAILKALMDKQL